MTPLGLPVVPDVKIMKAIRSGSASMEGEAVDCCSICSVHEDASSAHTCRYSRNTF